jgi:hypothetical protein
MKIKKTKEELIQAVFDQYSLLKMYCEKYDSGSSVTAKPMSVSLRLLFNQTKNQFPLLLQLGKRDIKWLNTSHGLHPHNEVAECSLAMIEVKTGVSARFKPKCDSEYNLDDYKMDLFPKWFNENVVSDTDKVLFSRRDLILYMADTDGGAHVDTSTEENYYNIKRPNFIDIGFGPGPNGSIMKAVGYIPEICMRQISFEVIYTLKKEFRF